MKEGIFKALELANYLNYKYYDQYRNNISPLKLQKVLFFLFAEWGGFVKKNDIQSHTDGSWIAEKFSPYLFSEEIQAWVYGPVVKDVYDNFKNGKNDGSKLFDTDDKIYIKGFIDDLSSDLFKLSDFRLVELSHQTKCWIDNFESSEPFHNNPIDKDTIINEFAL